MCVYSPQVTGYIEMGGISESTSATLDVDIHLACSSISGVTKRLFNGSSIIKEKKERKIPQAFISETI